MAKFYGIMLQPQFTYAQFADSAINITSVALGKGLRSKLCLTINDQKYVVATLTQTKPQVNLNLQFNQGEHFMFENKGNANLSVVGYKHPPTSYMEWEVSVDSDSNYNYSDTAEE